MIRRTTPKTEPFIPQWQTIYCSLMLLLVVFFVMLIAFSSINQERFFQKGYVEKSADAMGMTPEIRQAMETMQQLKTHAGLEKDFSVIKTRTGFKAVLSSPILFGSGDASLSEDIYPVLDAIADIAGKNNLSLLIEGHTDNVPIASAKYPSNWELSTMRAVNILRSLQSRKKIPVQRLAAVGFSEYRPVAGNDTPEGRRKNRRIEILFRTGT